MICGTLLFLGKKIAKNTKYLSNPTITTNYYNFRFGTGKYRTGRAQDALIQNTDKFIVADKTDLQTIARYWGLSLDWRTKLYSTQCKNIERFTPFFLTVSGKDLEFPAKMFFREVRKMKKKNVTI